MQQNDSLADGWKVRHGPITYDHLWHGEIYDANREVSDWASGKTVPSPCGFTAFAAKAVPLPCGSTAFAAKTVPLPCGFTAFAAKAVPLPCGFTAFAAKTVPLPCDFTVAPLAELTDEQSLTEGGVPAGWGPAVAMQPTVGQLSPQLMPPIRIVKSFKPANITTVRQHCPSPFVCSTSWLRHCLSLRSCRSPNPAALTAPRLATSFAARAAPGAAPNCRAVI